ncbi:hypothetical protein CHL_0360 [Campylobacter hyointestinalis subsp. lawsonii CCUG 27631]|uniref:transcriptional regulator n=1 Tax=Campylobacter hyointestinalis TaxID=198 RepID=UPI0007C9CA39|nr:transcriptional regulator [Campylobacter hyointestinalis]ANE33736.1 hypothetical protein CHL_0360 [Campylobacter hyointestinalis subsp. lawsonii CCUG 27631]
MDFKAFFMGFLQYFKKKKNGRRELKAFCKEQNLTYKELSELIGMTKLSLRGATSKNKISLQIKKAVELLKEVENLKEF